MMRASSLAAVICPSIRNLATGDYRLSAISPLIDQDAPAGTDVGALPFVPVGVPPTVAGITQVAEDQWQVTWQLSAAKGYQIHLGPPLKVEGMPLLRNQPLRRC